MPWTTSLWLFVSTYVLSICLDLAKTTIEAVLNFLHVSSPTQDLNSKEVVIIIPCHNSEDVIEQTLLYARSRTHQHPYRTILVANACTDNTLKVLEQYKEQADVEIINTATPGKMHAILLGVLRARELGFTHFLLLDDDVVWPPNVAISVYNKSDPISAIPVVPTKDPGLLVNWQIIEYETMVSSKRAQFQMKNVVMASGAAGVYRLDNFLETIKHHDGEHIGDDFQYCAINHVLGNRLTLLPDVVYTHAPSTLKVWWKQRANRWEMSPILNSGWILKIVTGARGGWWIALVSFHRILVTVIDLLRLVSFPQVLVHTPQILGGVALITYFTVSLNLAVYRLVYEKYAFRPDGWAVLAFVLYPAYGVMAWLSRLAALPRALLYIFRTRGHKISLHQLYQSKYHL